MTRAGASILVVDDEDLMREIVAFDLERRGHRVSHAPNGKVAFEMVQKKSFDLVITDVRMPSGNGTDLLGWIKNWNPISPSVMFMTAFADISADEALAQGAEAFLNKPLVREDLWDEVAKVLVNREERWPPNLTFEGVSAVTLTQTQTEYVHFGSGGAFVPLSGGYPMPLEIVAFDLPFAHAPDGRLVGFGRVRWVRQEAAPPPLAAGIGLEFVALAEPARAHYLGYLNEVKPRAYVPLGLQPLP